MKKLLIVILLAMAVGALLARTPPQMKTPDLSEVLKRVKDQDVSAALRRMRRGA